MSARIIHIYLLLILSSSILAFGQSGSPQAALEELATADDVQTVLRHLPRSVERAIERMSPEERAGLEKQLVVRRMMKEEGVELQRGSDGSSWELTRPSDAEGTNGAATPRKKILITIESAIENGDDALLIIDGRPEASATPGEVEADSRKQESALLRMKFEDGEWRITNIGHFEQVNIEDVVLKGLGRGESTPDAKEASTEGGLRALNTAIVSYQSAYESVGLPPTIAALTCWSDETCKDASADHAALLDSTFAASPLVRYGYEFQYTRISFDHYTITATPSTDQTARSRSFFTDQTGVIRFTQENRPATAQDPPLQ